MNYDPKTEKEIERELKALYEESRALADIFSGMHLTMCIGAPVENSAEIPAAEKSAWNTLFGRFGIGTNRIIWAEQLGSTNLAEKIRDWTERIQHSWDALNPTEYQMVIREVFSMPKALRSTGEFAQYVRDINFIMEECRDNFFQKTGLELPEDKAEPVRPRLNDVNSLEEYQELLITSGSAQIRECTDLVDKKNLRPIRLACSYVEQHYRESIKLEDVAEVVNLNPAYFSALFAKKTGQNFTEYVTLFRLKKACDMLAHSELNINEIADQLGFPDARYFSRLFRRKMGVKPTEYRKIYG